MTMMSNFDPVEPSLKPPEEQRRMLRHQT